ncbi:hypothetical protein Taro_054219 [Colocasia esculenta]|uniref:Protein kinase domain-containing protein n=1 Tax=Colocasia esculenta TaxID=4460 RepID=A0A843XMY8_COLES|nr:hypothetical protein [Colocasia esculenta]
MDVHSQLRNNFLNGTVDLRTDYGSKLRLVDLRNNKIEDVRGGGEQQPCLILAGNPYCGKRGRESSHCEIPHKCDSYSTPTSKCQQIVCSPDQKLSPDCRCGYPYVGTLVFLFNFSYLMDDSNYEALENKMKYYFLSQDVPVDSVALHYVTTSSENYLQIGLQIFPSGPTHFDQLNCYKIGYILISQMNGTLKDFGSYNFYVSGFDCGEGWAYTSKSKNILVIIGVSIGVFILAVTIIALVVYAARLKRKAQRVVERSKPFASWDMVKGGGDAPQIRGPKWFSFDELKRSTNNFSEANGIGTGSYGKVYKGMLVTGQHVAIKRAQQGSVQGGHEFKTEIELLSRVHHKNIVALVGFCFDQGEQMLVYEYISNGTLRDSLSVPPVDVAIAPAVGPGDVPAAAVPATAKEMVELQGQMQHLVGICQGLQAQLSRRPALVIPLPPEQRAESSRRWSRTPPAPQKQHA